MKTKISLIVVLVFICLAVVIFVACIQQDSSTPVDRQKLAAANNGFAFKLLNQLAKDQPVTNIFISPYSASTVLQMVGNGAAGRTKVEMQQILGTMGFSSAGVNAANKDIAQSLNSGNTKVILEIANAIWCRQGVHMMFEGFVF